MGNRLGHDREYIPPRYDDSTPRYFPNVGARDGCIFKTEVAALVRIFYRAQGICRTENYETGDRDRCSDYVIRSRTYEQRPFAH